MTSALERRQDEVVETLERRMKEIEAGVRERIEHLASLAGGPPRD